MKDANGRRAEVRGTAADAGLSPQRIRAVLKRAFPERQLIFRTDGRVRLMTLSTATQSVAVVVGLCLLGWAGVSVLGESEFERALVSKDRKIAAVTTAYDKLKSELGESETRFRSVARTLEAKHAYLMALLDRRGGTGGSLRAHPGEGTSDDPSLKRIETSRRAMLAQLGALEMLLKGRKGVGKDSDAHAATAGQPLNGIEWARMRREQKRLIARIDKLEERLLAVNGSQRGVMDFLAAQSVDDFARAKKLLGLSGLDVDNLLARMGNFDTTAQGGPFFAVGPDGGAVKAVPVALGVIDHQLDRWESLSALISRLPLSSPVDDYYVSSKYGKRRDPMNRRLAIHYGLDLAGRNRSPILATAPGVVTDVGWRGNYGRMVEIDHGLGVRTRYGHLRRILVKRGEKVGFRHRVGQMGSSGRSTGTHVHYEILVKGKPVDPAKFMKAGEHVLEGY